MKSKIITLGFFSLFSSGVIYSQSCVSLFSQAQSAFTSTFEAYQEFRKEAARLILSEPMADVADIALDLQTDIYHAAGQVAGNGQSSLGPRNLYIPCKNVTGTIVAGVGTERTFLTVPSLYDKVFITIKQTDGNSSANIAVCVKTADGTMVNKKTKGIDGKGKEIGFQFWGTEDKFITIHIVKPVGLNNFSYSLEISGEINMDKEDMKKYTEEIEAEGTASSKPNLKGSTKVKPNEKINQVQPKVGIPKVGSTQSKTVEPDKNLEKKTNEEPVEETVEETQEEMEERLRKEANQKAKAELKRREEERRREEKKEEMKQKAEEKAKEKHQSSGGN